MKVRIPPTQKKSHEAYKAAASSAKIADIVMVALMRP
jgi:hypothetical protein